MSFMREVFRVCVNVLNIVSAELMRDVFCVCVNVLSIVSAELMCEVRRV